MNRRKALKILGALVVCLGGRAEASELGLMDYTFVEEGIGKIIIKKKNGSQLIIPFSDIVKALEEK